MSTPLSPGALMGVAGLLTAAGIALYVFVVRAPEAPPEPEPDLASLFEQQAAQARAIAEAEARAAQAADDAEAARLAAEGRQAVEPGVRFGDDPQSALQQLIDELEGRGFEVEAGTLREDVQEEAREQPTPSEPPDPFANAHELPPEPEGNALLPDTPSRHDVARAMRTVTPAVEACVSEPGLTVVQLIFESSGSVQSVRMRDRSASGPELECIRQAILSGVRVPAFGRPSFSVNYPFRH